MRGFSRPAPLGVVIYIDGMDEKRMAKREHNFGVEGRLTRAWMDGVKNRGRTLEQARMIVHNRPDHGMNRFGEWGLKIWMSKWHEAMGCRILGWSRGSGVLLHARFT